MMKLMSGLVVLSAVLASHVAQAAPLPCVQAVIDEIADSGSCHGADINVVLLPRNGAWVSYTDSIFRWSGNKLSAGPSEQTFSDRWRDLGGSHVQRFNANEFDEHKLVLDPNTGVMTVTNLTWNFTSTVQLSCSGKHLIGTDEDKVFYVISHAKRVCGPQ